MTANVKIKDIAKAAGVSASTVSRALTANGFVAAATAEKIRKAAEALNYRPNFQARSLRTKRSMSILVVVRDIANPFYLEVFKGVEATAREARYSVLMGNTEGDPAREEEYFEMVRDGQADGMILMTGMVPEGYEDQKKKVVVATQMIPDSGLPHVLIDNAKSAGMAVEHLLSLGHTRIAHISGPEGEGMSEERKKGFIQTMENAGMDIPADYIQEGDYHLGSGLKLTARLLDLPVPPSAIFVANDEMAFGVLRVAQERGLHIPSELSVIGFDNIHFSQAVFPPLTTINQPRVEIGKCAMKSLLQLIAGEQPGNDVVLQTELVHRATTAAPQN
ncbi:MAG: LacI family DNA-binding transcriptional regulator [Psychromonas sp.]